MDELNERLQAEIEALRNELASERKQNAALKAAEDVLRMKVVAGRNAEVGIAAEGYDVERHGETFNSIHAFVILFIQFFFLLLLIYIAD